MIPEVYSDVDPSLHSAAARSLFATILYLVEENRVVAIGTTKVNGRYKLPI